MVDMHFTAEIIGWIVLGFLSLIVLAILFKNIMDLIALILGCFKLDFVKYWRLPGSVTLNDDSRWDQLCYRFYWKFAKNNYHLKE